MESIDHVLLRCTYFDKVWMSSCLREIMTHCTNLSFVDLVDQIMQRKNDPKIAIFFTISWMIWNKQNEARFGTPRPDPHFLAMSAVAHALEYLEANYGALSWGIVRWSCFFL